MSPLEKLEGRLCKCGVCRLPCYSWSHGAQAVKGLEVRVSPLVEQRLGTVEQERLGPPLEFGLGPTLSVGHGVVWGQVRRGLATEIRGFRRG